MKTKITELLDIKYPIFQGGMAWVADGDLAGAVSNAGGLGIIGGEMLPKRWSRQILTRLNLSRTNLSVSISCFCLLLRMTLLTWSSKKV